MSDLSFHLSPVEWFAVCLAFAMTINKAQGQRYIKVGLYLCKTVLSHGKLYAAFSRDRKAGEYEFKQKISAKVDYSQTEFRYESTIIL